jgi:hypothetical protein
MVKGTANDALDELRKQLEEEKKKNKELSDVVFAVKMDDVMGMDELADTINKQVADVSFLDAEDSCDWDLLDTIRESLGKVYECYDKLAGMDPNARVAMNKLRQRIIVGIQASKNTIKKYQDKLEEFAYERDADMEEKESTPEPASKKSAFDGIIGSVTNNMKEKANEIVATLQAQL